MNRTAKDASDAVAQRMVEAGFIGGLLLIAQIGYAIYQAWALCHGQAATAYDSVRSGYNPNTDEFDKNMFDKARRRVEKRVKRKRLDWSDHQVDTYTRELLMEVINTDGADVASACISLRTEDLPDED